LKEFILLFRGGSERIKDQSPEEFLAHMEQWKKWLSDLGRDRKVVAAQPLIAAGRHIVGKERIVVDGPFAEGKEILGGYLICKAATYDEAVAIANGCPVLDIDGIVEVREIAGMEDITGEYFRQRNSTDRKS
jgi:hypothetical protein